MAKEKTVWIDGRGFPESEVRGYLDILEQEHRTRQENIKRQQAESEVRHAQDMQREVYPGEHDDQRRSDAERRVK